MKIPARHLLGGVAFLALQACDPCFGVTNCGATQVVHVEGQIVDPVTSDKIADAEVVISLRNGSLVSTRTDETGAFEGTIGVDSAGRYSYDISVKPPKDSAIVIHDLACDVGLRSGGCPIGRIVSRPYFWDFARVAYRDANGAIVPNAPLTFRRRSGGRIYGKAVNGDLVTTGGTDPAGYVLMFGLDAFTTETVPVVGDVTVKLPPPLDSATVTGVILRPRITIPQAIPPYELQVGPTLRSTFLFYRGDTASHAVGVKVTFVRTGGIAIDSVGLTGSTDATGTVVLRPRPLARGQVVGTLEVEPPAPAAAFSITGVILSTHDDDAAPLVLSRDLSGASAATRGTRP